MYGMNIDVKQASEKKRSHPRGDRMWLHGMNIDVKQASEKKRSHPRGTEYGCMG